MTTKFDEQWAQFGDARASVVFAQEEHTKALRELQAAQQKAAASGRVLNAAKRRMKALGTPLPGLLHSYVLGVCGDVTADEPISESEHAPT